MKTEAEALRQELAYIARKRFGILSYIPNPIAP